MHEKSKSGDIDKTCKRQRFDVYTKIESISKVKIVDSQMSLLETKDIRVSIPQVFHVLVLNNVTCLKH
jgi:hypothetical protein